eukprot:2268116-Rhodomonas_salina.2
MNVLKRMLARESRAAEQERGEAALMQLAERVCYLPAYLHIYICIVLCAPYQISDTDIRILRYRCRPTADRTCPIRCPVLTWA